MELTYDPIAGKYYVYVNGVLDQTIVSSSKIFGGAAGCWIGSSAGLANYFMQGYIDKPEILPYCQHPAGTTYSVPSVAPSISAAGYASDWFDTVNMAMKSPSAASSASGGNPSFTSVNRLYLGEAITAVATISGVVIYNFMQTGKNGAGLPSQIGFSQSFQNMTANRVAGTTYYNTTSRPIFISASTAMTSGSSVLYGYVNGNLAGLAYSGGSSASPLISFIVPAGAAYSITNGGTASINPWCELR